MKYANWKIWVACAVVFIIMSPQNAAAYVSMNIHKSRNLVCSAKEHSMTYMKKIAKSYAHNRMKQVGWNNYEWKSLLTLWMRESKWDYTADNPRSTAFGIAQILDYPHNASITKQVDDGIKYIKHRYGTPSRALAHHFRTGWY